MAKLFLKCFINKLKFYKSNFETQFCQLARFTRKLVWGLYTWLWDTFFKTRLLYVTLELVGIRYRTFSEESVNSVWPNCHGISWWLVSTVGGEVVKPTHVHLSTFCWTRKVVLGLCSRTVDDIVLWFDWFSTYMILIVLK